MSGDVPAAPGSGTVPEHQRVALEAERAATEHWRRVAHQRGAALDAIRRRTAVRALLALERRTEPLQHRLAAARARIVARIAQAALLIRALPTRLRLRRRRAKLAEALRALPPHPPSEPRSISIVVVDANAVGPVATAALDADASKSDLLCFRSAAIESLSDGWLERLAAVIGGPVVAATPMLVHPERPLSTATPYDLRVRMLGIDLEVSNAGVPNARSHEAGVDIDLRRSAVEVAAGSAACLVVDRRAYEDVGGLASLNDLDAAMFDLCQRLRATGKSVVAVPSSVAFDHRPTSSMHDLTSPIRRDGPGWRAVVERHGPALVRSARRADRQPLSFALTVAAPSAKVAHRWGDWHLTSALGRSLRRIGHRVLVQTANRADDLAGRSCDVHVVLRGMAPVRRTAGQRHVLWVISHPEQIDTDECDEADLVLVASHRFARELRGRTSTPVEVLLQATDHRRFRPVPADPTHAHPVVVVAKTRDVLRPAVADALAVGLRPAIYGSGWEEFVDPDLIVADYVANEELPVVYSSAGVLLNDHWGTMRSWGFVSNRLFDALACGTPVISDHLPEIHDLFGGAVPTYQEPAELRALVDADLGDPKGARGRALAGRQEVLAAHTFDHRTRELLDAIARHRISPQSS